MLYSLFASITWRCILRLGFAANCLIGSVQETHHKNLIIDTDFFSDVEYVIHAYQFQSRRLNNCSDAGALLLASTLPNINLLAVNVNYPSSYSALAVSAILAHYGHADVPVGLRRPITNDSFFDKWTYEFGEYASKVAFHWSGGTLPWGEADRAWEPVGLYRKILSEQEDGSVTIGSIGFLENVRSSYMLFSDRSHC